MTRQVDRAKVVQIESALTTAARAQEEHRATQGTYTADARALGANPPVGVTLTVAQADATRYCIEATHSGLEGTWHVTSSSPAAEGSC